MPQLHYCLPEQLESLPLPKVPTMSNRSQPVSRRKFLTRAGAVSLAVPTFVSARALGLEEAQLPVIASSWYDRYWRSRPVQLEDLSIAERRASVSVCDVDRQHAEAAKKIVDEHFGNQDCQILKLVLIAPRARA